MFKSKAQKQKEREERVSQCKSLMINFLNRLTDKLESLRRLGYEIERNGDDAQSKFIISQYALIESYQQRVKKMILNFRIAEEMNDIGTVTKDFFSNMTTMAKEIGKLSSSKVLKQTVKEFSRASTQSEVQIYKAEELLKQTQEAFTVLTDEMNSNTPISFSPDEERIKKLFSAQQREPMNEVPARFKFPTDM